MEEDVPLAVPLALEEEGEPVKGMGSTGVTVITGYLGAGKTTFVNHILKSEHGKRIAVILNEFGEELGIEKAMINRGQENSLVEEWIELPNGCVCCSVKHSLVQALEQLAERPQRFDYILLETTGLANPGSLASVLWVDDELESTIHLNSVITVVDAKNYDYQLHEHKEWGKISEAFLQIAYADIVILNKIDGLQMEDETSGSKLMEIEKEIHQINSLARIVRSVHCDVDLNDILDSKSYETKVDCQIFTGKEVHGHKYDIFSRAATLLQSAFKQMLLDLPTISRSVHDLEVATICVTESGAVCLDKVKDWLEQLLWEKQEFEILRAKGVLNVWGSDFSHMLQAVRDVYEITPVHVWEDNDIRINKVVFIGKNLKSEDLSESFRMCKD